MKDSKIEWCDHTFNMVWGCEKVSPGCKNCYAERMSKRAGNYWGVNAERRMMSEQYWKQPYAWNKAAIKAGKPALVFAGSMCDVLEDRRDLDEPRKRLFSMADDLDRLIWLFLTKRPENYQKLVPDHWFTEILPDHIWWGTSIENQSVITRLLKLQDVPGNRFVSVEPILGAVDLSDYLCLLTGQSLVPRAGQARVEWSFTGSKTSLTNAVIITFLYSSSNLARGGQNVKA